MNSNRLGFFKDVLAVSCYLFIALGLAQVAERIRVLEKHQNEDFQIQQEFILTTGELDKRIKALEHPAKKLGERIGNVDK